MLENVGNGMTPADYRTAIATLGLSQLAAGRWLGVSPKTAQRYAVDGPSGPAARAVAMAVAMMEVQKFEGQPEGLWVRHSDLTAAVVLGG